MGEQNIECGTYHIGTNNNALFSSYIIIAFKFLSYHESILRAFKNKILTPKQILIDKLKY